MALLTSLQTKLALAFAAVVLVALGVSGAIFAFSNRDQEEQNQINRVAAVSPTIFAEFTSGAPRSELELERFARTAASNHDVRVLLVDGAGVVIQDSGSGLIGKTIGPIPFQRPQQEPRRRGGPPDQPVNNAQDGQNGGLANGNGAPGQPRGSPPQGQGQGRVTFRDRVWYPEKGSPAEGLALIPSGLPGLRFAEGPGGRTIPSFTTDGISLVLAVEEDTFGRAWLGVLPTLGRAAAFALPVAIILALFLARYITRPLQKLTLASQRMADGVFDIDVPADRKDELGRLSQSFVTMAARVGESQSQMRGLVANVSHDLKTPLTSILGFSRAIESGAARGEEETQRLGAIIREEAERLSTRLNDLTFLSELDAGQTLLEKDDIDFGAFVRSVTSRVVHENGRIREEIATDVIVQADAAKLERAIENLLDNALHYAPPQSTIELAVRSVANEAVLTLANAAPDLDPTEAPLLFQRFYRRDRSRASSDGSGLGLAIAREIIERHGGHLDAVVSDGQVTFSAVLPLARPA